jgi:hypothetical protein
VCGFTAQKEMTHNNGARLLVKQVLDFLAEAPSAEDAMFIKSVKFC